MGWTGTSIFDASVSEGHGFYGSYSEHSGAKDFASLDSNDGSVRIDGNVITVPGPNASDARNEAVDDSKADYSSFKLDLNAVPAAVRDDEFVDSVVQDYLKFLASGASDSDGASPGFWSDPMVALSFGLPLNDKSSRRFRAGCSSDGSSSGVIRCEIFEAVFSNFAPNSGAADSGRYEQDGANNNNSAYDYNYNSNNSNMVGNSVVGGAYIAALGTSGVSGVELVTTSNPCGCEVTTIPVSIPVSGVPPPEFYSPSGSGVRSGWGASSPPLQDGDDPPPPPLDPIWPGKNTNHTAAVPELPTSTLFLIGAGGLALALRRARNPLRGLFRA